MRKGHKRRRIFNSREEWAAYAVQVLKSGGGCTRVNLYSWRPSVKRLLIALNHAKSLGLVRENKRTRKDRRIFTLVEVPDAD